MSANDARSDPSGSNDIPELNSDQNFDDTFEQDDAVSSSSGSCCGSDIDSDVDEVCKICWQFVVCLIC